MITYKGLPAPIFYDFLSREASRKHYSAGTEFNIGKIEMVANTGTYVDSPFHRFADGIDLTSRPGVGVALHLQLALLTVVLSCLAFELWWGRRRQPLTYLIVLILAVLLTCVPWAWRNYKEFDTLIFIRSNFHSYFLAGSKKPEFSDFQALEKEYLILWIIL